MKAIVYHEFRGPVNIEEVSDPRLPDDGIILEVEATGLCRSDWHGWMGHDPDIKLPHVPGHEMAGTIVDTGKNCKRWSPGDRVTLPFVCGCGTCPECLSGNHQVCDHQFQPGFTAWGSFAQYVAIERADINLVALPDYMDPVTASSLGCRFITSYRAVVDQARVLPGQFMAVHGCGGVGLSAIMIGAAMGAQVIAVDISDEKLRLATKAGASFVINSDKTTDLITAIRDLTGRGAHVSIDALGHPLTCFNSVACLRKRGRHIQVGLMTGGQNSPALPMDLVIAGELEIYGSHGMQAFRYPDVFRLIETGRLNPGLLVGKTVSLEEAAEELPQMDKFSGTGVTVINRF